MLWERTEDPLLEFARMVTKSEIGEAQEREHQLRHTWQMYLSVLRDMVRMNEGF